MDTVDPSTYLDTDLLTTAQIVSLSTMGSENVEEDTVVSDFHSGLIVLSILIVISNLFAIQIYKRHEKVRRNVSNILLLSLAISDLLVGLLILPMLIFCEIELLKPAARSNEVLMHTCHVNYLLGNFCGFSTIFHIVVLTVEKYMAVLRPLQRLSVSTRGMYKKILLTIWILALLFALVPLFWFFNNPGSASWIQKFRIYGIVQLVVFFGVSVIILMYCYCRMFLQIHAKLSECNDTGRVRQGQGRIINDRKTIQIFILFFALFVIGWLPVQLIGLYESKDVLNYISLEVRDFFVSLRFLGAFLNPLLYAFLKFDYRQGVQSDLGGFCSRCPKPLRVHKLVQGVKTRQRSKNDNTYELGTLTTGTGGVRLQKIEPHSSPCHRPHTSSFTTSSRVQSLPYAQDANLSKTLGSHDQARYW